MRSNKYISIVVLLVFAALVATSCRKDKNPYDKIGDSGLTQRTENLRNNLFAFEQKGVMLGQMYGTLEGIGWTGDSARSDLQEISNEWPACVGYELSGIEQGKRVNTDSLGFSAIKRDIISYFQHQGLVVINWTALNPGPDACDEDSPAGQRLKGWAGKVAAFVSSLQDDYGIKVPVVLALYPQNGTSWYTKLSADDYKQLYGNTVDWLRDDNNLTNALFAYNTVYMYNSVDKTMSYCPEDDIDLVQLTYLTDNYNGYAQQLLNATRQMASRCVADMKAFGVLTGVKRMGNDTGFWTKSILPTLLNSRISYLMMGRNHGDFNQGNYYAPYPGSKMVADLITLCNHPRVLTMSKVNGLLINQSGKK